MILVLCLVTACKAKNNTAANDLQTAFQSGCSSTGTIDAQVALSQTQSLVNTIQDLRKNNKCTGLDNTQATVQNMSDQIYAMQQDQTTASMNSLSGAQDSLLAQINSTNDPASLQILTETYAANAISMSTLQGQEAVLAGSGLTTNLQRGYTQLNAYVGALQANTSEINNCAQRDPDFAAKIGAQLMSVSGNFVTPLIGAIITIAGGIIEEVINVVDDSTYSRTINKLNLVSMTTALSCSLESMSAAYCQAQDMMTLTSFEECKFNPNAGPLCKKQMMVSAKAQTDIAEFWSGIGVLSRSLPALQIWAAKVVSGVTPSDIYQAQKQNDLLTSRATLDTINNLDQGWESQENSIIKGDASIDDQHQESVRALSQLVNYMYYTGPNGKSPIASYYPSTSTLLYALVGLPFSCVAGDSTNPCLDVTTIPLPGDTITTANGRSSRVNGNGGWDAIIKNERAIFQQVYNQIDAQLQAVDNVDPSSVIEAVKIPAGTGLPSPYEALKDISLFLQSSQDFYATVAPEFLDGGEAGRPGTLSFIASTKTMVDTVLSLAVSGSDVTTLSKIYNTFQLGLDPNFITQRLTVHIKEDLGTRIKAGQGPKSVTDILYGSTSDPSSQLNAIPASQIDRTKGSLATAITTSQANTNNFVKYFRKSLKNTLKLLKEEADSNHEPMGGSPSDAPFRSTQAKLCVLIAGTQGDWPSKIDPDLCTGTFLKSDLTGEIISSDAIISNKTQGSSPDKMCTLYRFFRNSSNFTRGH